MKVSEKEEGMKRQKARGSETQEKWEYRADTGVCGEWQLTPEGYLIASAKIARIGIQEYKNPDGSVRREYRPKSEVAKTDSLKSLCKLPLTSEHPPTLLNSTNTKDYLIGWSGDSVTYDGGFVVSDVKIIDDEAVKEVLENRRVELSVGYLTKLEWTPGEFNGERYDCIQRNIKGNHLALTVKARGGKELRLYPNGIKADSVVMEEQFCWDCSCSSQWEEMRFDNDTFTVGENQMNEDEDFYPSDDEDDIAQFSPDELAELSQDDLIGIILELQSALYSGDDEIEKAMDSAAFYEGQALALRHHLDSVSRNDSGTVTQSNGAFTDVRLKEQRLRIQELENHLDALNEQLSGLGDQRLEFQSIVDRLERDLQYERQRRDSDIIASRQEWIDTWNTAYPFLPQVARENPDCTLDSLGIMRLALQNSRPSLNLDSLVENANNPVDAIVTAFSMMVAEGVKDRRNLDGSAMSYLIHQAKNDSSYVSPSESVFSDKVSKLEEAWRVRN